MSTNKSVFQTLSSIDVNSKVEKKNGLTYLSWAWAWSVVKEHFPTATYIIYENGEGFNYHHDGNTAWVKTGVTIDGIEHIEYLPIMDYRNRSIGLAELTSFDVNKAIQRSLTKAIARHGLGLYIYAGEDLPTSTETQPQAAEKPQEGEYTKIELNVDDANWSRVMKYVAANKDKGLSAIVRTLKTKYLISNVVKEEIKRNIQ